jgi:hypothetical protein
VFYTIVRTLQNLFSKALTIYWNYGPGVDSASNRNEYQESPWGGKGRPERKADNLADNCEPIVEKIC